MSKAKTAMTTVAFDLKGWRCDKTPKVKVKDLARVFGISTTQVWRLERAGAVPQIYVWACKGFDTIRDRYKPSAGDEKD